MPEASQNGEKLFLAPAVDVDFHLLSFDLLSSFLNSMRVK